MVSRIFLALSLAIILLPNVGNAVWPFDLLFDNSRDERTDQRPTLPTPAVLPTPVTSPPSVVTVVSGKNDVAEVPPAKHEPIGPFYCAGSGTRTAYDAEEESQCLNFFRHMDKETLPPDEELYPPPAISFFDIGDTSPPFAHPQTIIFDTNRHIEWLILEQTRFQKMPLDALFHLRSVVQFYEQPITGRPVEHAMQPLWALVGSGPLDVVRKYSGRSSVPG